MNLKKNVCIHSQKISNCSRCSLNQTFNIDEVSQPSELKQEAPFVSSDNIVIEKIEDVYITSPDSELDQKEEEKTNTDKSILSQESNTEETIIVTNPLVDPPSWTLRLIASDRFSVPMAIEYLHTIHDKPSLTYLGKRLFDLPESEVDFFLPQLMFMYVHKIDVASVTHAYIEKRHFNNPHFSLICTWLLDCFIAASINAYLPNHALMLRAMLKKDVTIENESSSNTPVSRLSTLSLDNLEQTDWMSSSCKRSASSSNFCNVDIELNQSFSNIDKNQTRITKELTPKEWIACERNFIEKLMQIGKKLTQFHLTASKLDKMAALKIELQILNVVLPAPVWIPFDSNHKVLKICFDDSSVLNSKEKVPYILFVEIMRSPSNFFLNVPPNRYTTPLLSNDIKHATTSHRRIKVYHDTSDPSAAVFSESWHDKRERIRSCSEYGGYENWDIIPVIVKYGDDLTQEALAQQFLQIFKDLWEEEGVPLYVRPYKIVCVSQEAGLIEPVLDTMSLHQIKRHLTRVFRQNGNPLPPTLRHHFEDMFGPCGSELYVNAQKNFIQSTASYSLLSYFLQLKDRHNGNILLDLEGHLIHIDFGFLLSASPRNLGFETAPFKLTTELIDVMGGLDSDMFLYYKSLLLRGLMAARKHHRRIVSLAEIMSQGSKMPCFRAGQETVRALEARFHVSSTDEQLQNIVDSLVDGSRDSYTTRFYDSFQYYTNGIH